MSLTKDQLISNVATFLERPDDTTFKTFLGTRLDQMLFAFFDMHDWNFKHKDGTFNTVASTESYDLSVSSIDLRSSQDLEILWDSTNKRPITKTDLKTIRRQYPEGSDEGQPTRYAPWGPNTIVLDKIPNGAFVMKYLYLTKATLPSGDNDDLEAVCGVPEYVQFLLEKMVLAEGMFLDNDNRRDNLLVEIEKKWKPLAVNADMKHLESTARFKFWEEELLPLSYDELDPLGWNS